MAHSQGPGRLRLPLPLRLRLPLPLRLQLCLSRRRQNLTGSIVYVLRQASS
jgi:hypothetical protein